MNKSLAAVADAQILVLPPPPIQGVGNDAGFTMQIELRDGSFDLAKLQRVTDAIVANAKTQSALQFAHVVVPRQRAAIFASRSIG